LRNGQYDAFRQKYRSVDVLIFDDVQFLEGKASAQEELYYTFDYLYQNNKLLVFSANRYPSLISGLENYLYTKFEQGVVIGIDLPDPHVCQVVATRLANSYKLGLDKEAIL
jgi:chromosomal replication initiator protein